jgi:hypothetical protein
VQALCSTANTMLDQFKSLVLTASILKRDASALLLETAGGFSVCSVTRELI